MSEPTRPTLALDLATGPVVDFVRGLQDAINRGDADLFNRQFAADVLWGSPFGAVARGYEQIHAIHARMFAAIAPVPGSSRYELEDVSFPTEEVAIAYVRRLAVNREAAVAQDRPGSFDELALFVLVKKEEKWWLAAAQHVPDRREVYATS